MKTYGKIFQFLLLGSIFTVVGLFIFREWQARQPQRYQLALLPVPVAPVWRTAMEGEVEQSERAELFSLEKQLFEASISAQAYFVLDLETDTILLEKNSQEAFPPASVTKLMTAVVSREAYDLEDVVSVATPAAQENGGGLLPQENITVRDLIAATLVSSANDAAFALAFHGDPTNLLAPMVFVAKMNQTAQRYGLQRTTFQNPAGYDSPSHLSTARDIAVLARKAFQDAELRRFLGLESYVIENQEKTVRHFLYTTNDFLGQSWGEENGIMLGKTGTTELAGQVLVSLVQQEGREFIIVVMGSEDRYLDTLKLLDWVKVHYQWQETELDFQAFLDSARESL